MMLILKSNKNLYKVKNFKIFDEFHNIRKDLSNIGFHRSNTHCISYIDLIVICCWNRVEIDSK